MSTFEIWLIYAFIFAVGLILVFSIGENAKNKFLKVIQGIGAFILFLTAVPFAFITLIAIFYPEGLNPGKGNANDSNSSRIEESVEVDGENTEDYDTGLETFMGYECTDDCSGHEAGFEWAYDNDVCDPDFYDGYSDSFNEGVHAYYWDSC